MPQCHPTRASLRQPTTRARRVPRRRAMTTGLATAAVAALTATTVVPESLPAAPAQAQRAADTIDAHAVTISGTAPTPSPEAVVVTAAPQTTPEVEAAVAQASGVLVKAEHVAAESADAPAEDVEEIAQTTAVVRELLRRAAPESPSDAAAAAQDAAEAALTQAAPSVEPTDLPEPADATAAPAQAENAPETASTTRTPSEAVIAAADAAVTAAADAADVALGPALAVAAALTQQSETLKGLIETGSSTVVVTPAPPTAEQIAAEKAAEAAADAAHLAELAASAAGYGNGQIPASVLRELPWAPGESLRADAAVQLERLNEAFFARFGTHLDVVDSYRSYAAQVATKRARGFWAAVPGTSNHGWGVAVDLGGSVARFGGEGYAWLAEHAAAFGWVNPDWARPGGSKPEPWHWEYTG
ncbi:M15 family metallopeptidase [Xylanimonas ulmi]|uniref:D-alanyl-D-alanine carboxypeptidase-like protein n=1 Tax=Xylanimonas ulmi TaxID=228973 RepID=A0A4V2EYA4_9MICO|nr:M15 family metallopeptidase [Xylanibacterium ulmi]RZS62300.1 D-alanyl-D-alanine carboxypeptidase-like protein [Xylanibacterium ulmi]